MTSTSAVMPTTSVVTSAVPTAAVSASSVRCADTFDSVHAERTPLVSTAAA